MLLESERIIFRTWQNDDIDKATLLWGDKEVTKYIGGPFSEEQIRGRLKKEMDNQNKHGIQYWPIYLKNSNEFIGCCGLRPCKDQEKVCELGFHLCKEYWGKGIALEAATAVLKYGFEEKRFKKILAGHNPQNEKSRIVLGKLGFTYIRDEYYAPTGLNHPTYEITYEAYRKKQKGRE